MSVSSSEIEFPIPYSDGRFQWLLLCEWKVTFKHWNKWIPFHKVLLMLINKDNKVLFFFLFSVLSSQKYTFSCVIDLTSTPKSISLCWYKHRILFLRKKKKGGGWMLWGNKDLKGRVKIDGGRPASQGKTKTSHITKVDEWKVVSGESLKSEEMLLLLFPNLPCYQDIDKMLKGLKLKLGVKLALTFSLKFWISYIRITDLTSLWYST